MPMRYVPLPFGRQRVALWPRNERPGGAPWSAQGGGVQQVAPSLPALQVLKAPKALPVPG